ncbi:hypothetical protein E2562_035500 [Oryza meyeriana var. granulata]|uniref:Uncharacterized protein n=1 Tax=Oryza meyeriana var. granulata TaxID=110450 RepID=A0A6G1ESP6_9ORYZ|nr:hypothetical protein E2562_035500 [Oryza meyeriana var. granulata]
MLELPTYVVTAAAAEAAESSQYVTRSPTSLSSKGNALDQFGYFHITGQSPRRCRPRSAGQKVVGTPATGGVEARMGGGVEGWRWLLWAASADTAIGSWIMHGQAR